jgi:hypothetical protein
MNNSRREKKTSGNTETDYLKDRINEPEINGKNENLKR